MSLHADARRVAEAVARESYGKLVALLAGRHRDIAAAEDALASAFAEALARWPTTGVPDNPPAWLLSVARRRVIDEVRRGAVRVEAQEGVALLMDERADAGQEAESLPDERLGLMFACAHPAIDPAIRAPLILQTILGFDAAAIAAAFLVPPATMAQRLVRAKKKIREAGIPFRKPGRDEIGAGVDPVLDAVYAAYSRGWTDPGGADPDRRDLALEGLFLGRLLAALLPEEPEALGLLALMLHGEARRAARRAPDGAFVPLGSQDTRLWNLAMIEEAEALLRRAAAMRRVGRFQLEAAVQSAHAARRFDGLTDWRAILRLYDGLVALTDSPVAALNRAVALSEVEGPDAALAALAAADGDDRLAEYQPFWAATAAFHAAAGRPREAADAYDRAIALESDPSVIAFLEARRDALHP